MDIYLKATFSVDLKPGLEIMKQMFGMNAIQIVGQTPNARAKLQKIRSCSCHLMGVRGMFHLSVLVANVDKQPMQDMPWTGQLVGS